MGRLLQWPAGGRELAQVLRCFYSTADIFAEIEHVARVNLDDVDLGLIRLLQQDGRLTNKELSDRLGIAPNTVRKHLKRLESTKAMRVVAIEDIHATGNDFMALLWIRVESRPIELVAADMAALPSFLTVSIVAGEYDIRAVIIAQDQDQLSDVMINQLGSIEGIARVDSALILDVLRSEPLWARF